MKSLFFTVIFSLTVFLCHSQEKLFERQVPRVVKEAFINKYPDVNTVDWFKNNDSVIEAHFVLSRKKTMAGFSNEGIFLSSSSEIAQREAPGLISNYVRGEYPEQTVNVVMMTEDANGQISYYMEISRPGVNQPLTKLYFDFYGNVTRVVLPPERAMGDVDSYLDEEGGVGVGEPIKRREIPPVIMRYVEQEYQGYRFESAVFVEKDPHGMVYEIRLRKQGYRQYANLYFDLMGKFLEAR